jgi:GT2 family glycosyltransferase
MTLPIVRKAVTDPAPLVYVVTLTWNQQAHTLHCLESLCRMTYPNFRLLLVDNGSTDGTVEAVRERFPQVELIINPKNLGFSGGFNAGLAHALAQGAPWVFMINNDTYVAPDLLDELMAYSEVTGVGMLGPKIYSAELPDHIWSVGGERSFWTYEMVATGDGQVDRGQWEQPRERDYLVGCALLIKRSLLENVGLFDAVTFDPIYYEDTDFSLRARQVGYRLLLVPSARMWHKGVGAGGGFDSPRQRYLMGRNSVRFFRKHVRGLRWLVVIPYRFGSAVKTTWRLWRTGHRQSIDAHWRGLLDGVLNRHSTL